MLVEEVPVPPTVLGESPHWCAITESLFYIDITAKTIFRYIPSAKKTESMIMDSAVGFAIPTSATVSSKIILYVGLEKNVVEVNFTTKEVLRIVSSLPSSVTDNCRFNDGKCNSRGQLYAGYMNIAWRDGLFGNVYQLTHFTFDEAPDAQMDLQPMFEIDEIHLPNGLAWNKRGDVYYIDSGKHSITCYRESVSAHKSNVLDRVSCVFTLGENDRSFGYMLDGMTIDNNGKLWVSSQRKIRIALMQYSKTQCIRLTHVFHLDRSLLWEHLA
jgi:sugar lactone lactonase YvrE